MIMNFISWFSQKLWSNILYYREQRRLKYTEQGKLDEELRNAVIDNNVEKSAELIAKGANVNANYGEEGYSNLGRAIYNESNSSYKLAELFLKNGANIPDKILLEVDEVDNPEIFKLLVEHGANINAQSDSGKTKLIYIGFRLISISSDKLAILNFLLEQGSDPNFKDNEGKTVLMYYLKNVHFEEASKIIEYKAGLHLINGKKIKYISDLEIAPLEAEYCVKSDVKLLQYKIRYSGFENYSYISDLIGKNPENLQNLFEYVFKYWEDIINKIDTHEILKDYTKEERAKVLEYANNFKEETKYKIPFKEERIIFGKIMKNIAVSYRFFAQKLPPEIAFYMFSFLDEEKLISPKLYKKIADNFFMGNKIDEIFFSHDPKNYHLRFENGFFWDTRPMKKWKDKEAGTLTYMILTDNEQVKYREEREIQKRTLSTENMPEMEGKGR